MTKWVTCPICGEPDMRKVTDGDGAIIHCVNIACASNGGTNWGKDKSVPPAMTDHATRARKKAVKELVDKFLAWPLPASVCADLCATKQGYPHRSGTTLLSADEARQMIEYLFAAALDQAAQETKIKTRCPSCGNDTLFIGDKGAITCSWLPCKSPSIEHFIKELHAAQPVWSKEKPTVSGEYWHRGVKSDDPVVVRVMAAGKKLLVLYPGDPLHYTLPQDGERGVSGEWAPILLPREA